jgi:hypothetical protein
VVIAGEKTIPLTLDGDELAANTYTFNLKITYNHPVAPDIIIPVVVQVTSNRSPESVNAISDQLLKLGTSGSSINLAEYFSDPDQDLLVYSVENNFTAIVTTVIQGSVVTLSPLTLGTGTLKIKAEDPAGDFVSQDFTFTVFPANHAPVIIQTLEDMSIGFGLDPISINLAEYFSDEDANEVLRFGAVAETSLLKAEITGSVLKITSMAVGEATVTVWAEDRELARTDMSFNVSVLPVTGVERNEVLNAIHFFPNPFAASAVIEYTLRESGHIQLLVYDLTGKVKQIIIDEEQPAGKKRVLYDGSDIQAGMYFYQFKFNGKPLGVRKLVKQ